LPDLHAVSAALAKREEAVPALRPDCAKEIIWGAAPGAETEWSVVFIHGFSASKHEIRPLPDMVAKALGANLFLTRLAGHGQDSEAMGRVRIDDWREDVSEAFDIGAQLGRRVLVIGCSTGCTLAASHLAGGPEAAGLVQVSPNYGLRFWPAQKLLEWPGLNPLHDLTVGRALVQKPKSPEHEAWWTLSYPLSAVAVTAEAVKLVEASDLSKIKTPTFIALNPNDTVISPQAAKAAAKRWGAPVEKYTFEGGPDDDELGHVMAGDVFSPNQTAPLARRILDWTGEI